ncbi:hypothetical protein ACP70R_007868 [Stipagrostis hirtigluma subsp. patula]
MDLLTGAVGSLIPKLYELLKDEYNLQKGVPEQINFLIKELECAHAALEVVAAQPPEQLDPLTRIWAREVREASYDMEDILDTFLVRVQGGHEPADKKNLFKGLCDKMAKLFKKSKERHNIAGAIEEIKKRLQEVTDRRNRFTIARPDTPSTIDPRVTAMSYKLTQLVGTERSKVQLMSKLLSHGVDGSNDKMKVVSIVGVGGLGKTTLAKVVYDELKLQYDTGAFVSVGRNPKVVAVLKKILVLLDKEKYTKIHCKEIDVDLLINEVQEFLGNKGYFIVIDDIWEKQSWDIIKTALVDNNSKSRIIITTRNLEVATGDVYKLQPLLHDDSKRLFYTRIFGGEGKCPDDQLDKESNKILKKCSGIPLAIITMASFLVGKSRDQWFEICKTFGFRDKDNREVHNTMRILSLSYHDLPQHLKTCLLYLSAFPEDYVIDKNPLIWKWIAEGFVREEQGIRLFEIGERYFHDLINRSLIQGVESTEYGIIDGCQVHDMMLELLCSLSHDENIITILDNDPGTVSGRRSCVRRLAHHNRTLEPNRQDKHMNIAKARSFIACKCTADKGFSLMSFKLLRVLALEDCSFKEDGPPLEHLGKLVHLRYLGLRGSYFFKLPEEIGALKSLQTLDLQRTRIRELPSSVGLLTQLISIKALVTAVPSGIVEKLTSLEELHISYGGDDKGQFAKELGNLSELRVLRTSYLKVKHPDLFQSLGRLHKLQYLELGCWFDHDDMDKVTWDEAVLPRNIRYLFIEHIPLQCLPSCINPSRLPNLSHLQLSVIDMDEQSLKILGGLPELRYLYLTMGSTVTVTDVAADGCFQKLRFCILAYSLVQFVFNEDSSFSFTLWNGRDSMVLGSKKKGECRVAPAVMPNLEEICFLVPVWSLIRNNGSCDNLGLEYLRSLQKVRVNVMCRDAFADDVEKVEAALRFAVGIHPNHPTLEIVWWGKGGMIIRPDQGEVFADDDNSAGEQEDYWMGSFLQSMMISPGQEEEQETAMQADYRTDSCVHVRSAHQ